MTRYFFHVYDDVVALDDEGLELADADAARREALAGARALAADQVKKGRLDLRHRIEVADEAGAPVLRVTFEEAVQVTR
jgi:hypothetical protein